MNTDKCLAAKEAGQLLEVAHAKVAHAKAERAKAERAIQEKLKKTSDAEAAKAEAAEVEEAQTAEMDEARAKAAKAKAAKARAEKEEKAAQKEFQPLHKKDLRDSSHTLEVEGYSEIDAEAAKLLVQWVGDLKLTGLKKLSEEVAAILHTRLARVAQGLSDEVDCRNLEKVGPAAARFILQVSEKENDFLAVSLDWLKELDAATARVLARCKGPLSCRLKTLEAPVAKALNEYKGPFPVQADKLERMDDISAEILAERFANPASIRNASGTGDRGSGKASQGSGNHGGVKGTTRKFLVLTSLKHLSDAACRSFLKHNTGVRVNPLNLESIGSIAARRIAERVGRIRLDSLKVITKETAEALVSGPARDNAFLSLGGLKELDPGVAEVLSGFKGSLRLNGLEKLSLEQAAILAGHTGELHLDGLRELEPETAGALAKHKGVLSLNGLSKIDHVAECLSAHNGIISLGGLRNLPDEAFEALGDYAVWGNGRHDHLETVSERLADALSVFEGTVSLEGLTSLTRQHANKLSRCKGVLHLGLAALSEDIAAALVASKGYQNIVFSNLQNLEGAAAEVLGKVWSLDFPRLSDLSAEAAKGLGGCGMLRLGSLRTLSAKTAEALAGSGRLIWLELNGVNELDPSAAGHLAVLKQGTLVLNGLAKLNLDSFISLVGCRCTLVLNGLSKLPPKSERALANSPCPELYLNGLIKIPRQAAEALAGFKGKLMLAKVAELDEESAMALSKAAGEISLRGLKTVTHRGFFELKKNTKITGLENVQIFLLSNTGKQSKVETLTLDTKIKRDHFYRRIFETVAAETAFKSPADLPGVSGVSRTLRHWLECPVTLEPRTYGMKRQEKYSAMFGLQSAIAGFCCGRYKDAFLDEFQVLCQYLEPSIKKNENGDKGGRLDTVYPIKSWQSLASLVSNAADNACLTTLRGNKLRIRPKVSIHERFFSADSDEDGFEMIDILNESLWENPELESFRDALLWNECNKAYRKVIKAIKNPIKRYIAEITYKADYLKEIPHLTWKDMQDKIRIKFHKPKMIGQSDISRAQAKFKENIKKEWERIGIGPR